MIGNLTCVKSGSWVTIRLTDGVRIAQQSLYLPDSNGYAVNESIILILSKETSVSLQTWSSNTPTFAFGDLSAIRIV